MNKLSTCTWACIHYISMMAKFQVYDQVADLPSIYSNTTGLLKSNDCMR